MDRIAKVKSAYSMADVVHRLGLITQVRGGELYALCPMHDDHTPSMHIQSRGRFANTCKCWACGAHYSSIIDLVIDVQGFTDHPARTAVGQALDWLEGEHHQKPMRPPPEVADIEVIPLNVDLSDFCVAAFQNCSVSATRWLAGRGLAPVMQDFCLGSTDGAFPTDLLPESIDPRTGRNYKQRAFLNRIIIPYLNPSQKITHLNARAMQGGQKPKYLKPTKPQGGGNQPYLLDMVLAMDCQQVWLTEGELDCLSVYAALPNVAACGLPGVHTLSDERLPDFDGRDVIIIFDNDEAGVKARAGLERRLKPYARSVAQAYIHPEHNDVNDMLVGKGRRFTAGWLEAIRKEAVGSKVYRTK